MFYSGFSLDKFHVVFFYNPACAVSESVQYTISKIILGHAVFGIWMRRIEIYIELFS